MSDKNTKITGKNLRLLQTLNQDEEIIWNGKSRDTFYTKVTDDNANLAFVIAVGLALAILLAVQLIESKFDIRLFESGRRFIFFMIFLLTSGLMGVFLQYVLKKLHFARALFVVTNQRFFEFMPDAGITEICFGPDDISRVVLSENTGRHSDVILTGTSLDGDFRRVIVAENEDASKLFEVLKRLKESQQ